MEKDLRTTKRRWIKLYPTESINGSIRYQLTSAERGVWYDLLCFSSLCSNTGDICDRDGNEFPPGFIANRLNIPAPLLKSTLQKCATEGRITADEHGLHITNWDRYQSEYDRQKPYRQRKTLHEANQAYLAAHPEKVINPPGEYEEQVEGEEGELARGDESLEEHEAALMEQSPAVKKFVEENQ